jgi:hypothetical protein
MVGPAALMLQFATTFPVTVKELLAVAASASGARAASASSTVRLAAHVQRSKSFRRLLKGSPFGFDSQTTGPAPLESTI